MEKKYKKGDVIAKGEGRLLSFITIPNDYDGLAKLHEQTFQKMLQYRDNLENKTRDRRDAGRNKKESKSIKATISEIKNNNPNITAKSCWYKLVELADASHMVTVDGDNYILELEQIDQTDLCKVRVTAINDQTGEVDGRGITQGTLGNKFKKI